MMDEHQLQMELDKIKSALQKNEWKYYHLQSVENFIYHLRSFKSQRIRESVAIEIENYLKLVSEKMLEESKVHKKGKDLFPSIWRLSDTYKYEVGFIQKPSYLVTFILAIPLFFLLKFYFTGLVSLAICASIFVIYVLYGYLKIKARKVF